MAVDEKSAGAVICLKDPNTNDRKFLLLHYTSGHWDFAKGNIEKNESEVQAVIRETKEETGISDLELVEGFREVVAYKYRHGNKLVNKEVAIFLAYTKTARVEISHEHIGYAWLSYDEAVRRLTYKNSKRVLEAAAEFLGE